MKLFEISKCLVVHFFRSWNVLMVCVIKNLIFSFCSDNFNVHFLRIFTSHILSSFDFSDTFKISSTKKFRISEWPQRYFGCDNCFYTLISLSIIIIQGPEKKCKFLYSVFIQNFWKRDHLQPYMVHSYLSLYFYIVFSQNKSANIFIATGNDPSQ